MEWGEALVFGLIAAIALVGMVVTRGHKRKLAALGRLLRLDGAEVTDGQRGAELTGRLGPRRVSVRAEQTSGHVELRLALRPRSLPPGTRLEPAGVARPKAALPAASADARVRVIGSDDEASTSAFSGEGVRAALAALLDHHPETYVAGDEIIVRGLTVDPAALRACCERALELASAVEGAAPTGGMPSPTPRRRVAIGASGRTPLEVQEEHEHRLERAVKYGLLPMVAAAPAGAALAMYGPRWLTSEPLAIGAIVVGLLLVPAINFARIFRCAACERSFVGLKRASIYIDTCPHCGVRLQ